MKFSEKAPPFLVDPRLLRIVFQNLLSNAINYTSPEGKIEISISTIDNAYVYLQVSDTGCGIPKNQHDQIFTKFFRADNVRENDTHGTGLGLYIIKSIIEEIGGRIWFESEENKGAVFHVVLPINN